MTDPRPEIRWFCRGRPATQFEVRAAIRAAGERQEVKNSPNRDSIRRLLRGIRP